jgi:hypothetical protein
MNMNPHRHLLWPMMLAKKHCISKDIHLVGKRYVLYVATLLVDSFFEDLVDGLKQDLVGLLGVPHFYVEGIHCHVASFLFL